MTSSRKLELESKFLDMFKCDAARITTPSKTHFLVIGFYKEAKNWQKNGKPITFSYLSEEVIASGKTIKELMASAKLYKKLSEMTKAEAAEYVLAHPTLFRKRRS